MKKFLGYIVVTVLALLSNSVNAQQNAMSAQYFQNGYLANPAMAGFKGGLALNLGYRKEATNMPDGPQMSSATADYGFENVGLGVNFYRDQAGLLSNTKVMVTYAYHLTLNDNGQKLRFGISLGRLSERLNTEDMIGSAPDQTALQFNSERKAVLDADFGVAFTSDRLVVEGALGNLKKHFNREDRPSVFDATTYFGISYQLRPESWLLTPKVVYRGLKNYQDLVDLGFELRTNNQQLGFTSFYHSNNSLTFGIAYKNKQQWQLLCLYNTPTKAIKAYTSGGFELGFQVAFNKKKL